MRVQSFFLTVCWALLLAAPTWAFDEESNGVIARHPFPSPTADEVVFESDFDGQDHLSLWIASIDGKHLRKLATGCDGATSPTWSPNGKTILFICSQKVMSVSPDGMHLRQLGSGVDASWSPNSQEIAFADGGEVWTMNADGTDRRLVTSTIRAYKSRGPHAQPLYADHPSFSPSGRKIVFSLNDPGVSASLMVVNRDGSDVHILTSGPYQDWGPQWSSLGVLFSSDRDLSGRFKPWLIQPDGGGLHKLSDFPALDPVFLSSGLVVFGDEMADKNGSQISVLDPHSQIKRLITNLHSPGISPSAAPLDHYVACGCGCCSGEQAKDQCLYRAQGHSLEEVSKDDQALQHSSVCQLAGCSKGVRYHYCD